MPAIPASPQNYTPPFTIPAHHHPKTILLHSQYHSIFLRHLNSGEITNREMHDHESVCNDNNTVNFSERDFDTPWTTSICNEGDVYVNTNHSDDNNGNSDKNCKVTSNRLPG